MDMTTKQANLLKAECDMYRRALISVYVEATDGKRKTIDKADIADRFARVIDDGNRYSRMRRGEA